MKTKTLPMDLSQFEAKASEAAFLLKAMSNEKRLMILCRLGANESSVSELLFDINLSQSALSQHLAVLKERDLVATRRDGQTIYYRIADPAVGQVIQTLASIYCPELLQ